MKKELTEMRSVRIHFTKEEKEKLSSELAESCKTKQEAEAEKKSVVSQLKAKIDAQDSRISYLSNCISTGYSFRNVECVVKKDHNKGMKEYYHDGVLVDSIPMTQEDSQLSIAE